jgi:hypothetical protein
MDENLLRFLMLAVFVAGMLGIAGVTGELSTHGLPDPFEDYYPDMEFGSVSKLLEMMPLEEHVSVPGTVTSIGDDFVSSSGSIYQQFFISDGSSEVKVFCSTLGGRADVSEGSEVVVSGKFQKYYDSLEIYADCPDVAVRPGPETI